MNKAYYVVGIDGGGTKTHAVIATMEGVILTDFVGGPSNMQITGVEKTAETIFRLIVKCCKFAKCDFSQVAAVGCGLAGAGRGSDQARMKRGLEHYAASHKVKFKKIVINSDARTALEGAFDGAPGIILIAGTGSIAFGKDVQGDIHRVGGWGRYLDDEGSGYYIGKRAIAAVARYLDGLGRKTTLIRDLAVSFGLKDQSAIIDAVYRNNFDIASVAPLVLQGAEKKDPVCVEIVQRAVIALSDHVRILTPRVLSADSTRKLTKVQLVFIGGLISHDTILARLLKKYIQRHIPRVEIVHPMASPAHGAVLLALHAKK